MENQNKGTAWEYTIALEDDVRMYTVPGQPNKEKRKGRTWLLNRSCKMTNGETFTQSIVCSPDVFKDKEDALEDALRRIAILYCSP